MAPLPSRIASTNCRDSRDLADFATLPPHEHSKRLCGDFFHYTLKDDAGEVIDSSDGGEPLAYIHGHGNLVPAGLERELTGKVAGDKLDVKIIAGRWLRRVRRGHGAARAATPVEGHCQDLCRHGKLHAQTQEDPREVTVTQVLGDTVTDRRQPSLV